MAYTTNWPALVEEKRRDRDSRIPEEWRLPKEITKNISPTSDINTFQLLKTLDLLTAREVELTENYEVKTLLEMMATRRVSSFEITTAFCKRAAIAQQLTNCLTEIMFAEAGERAKYLDEYLSREGKPLGPFHGMPISVKDCFMVKGQASTLGYVSYLTKPVSDHNSTLIDTLLAAGAVLYVKTNVPQTMLTMESVNHVFGRTLNPNKLSLTAGGSSGGEGALVAFRGSVLGVGTDIGGSIRVPPICCGAYGFKPTADRIPFGRQQFSARKGSPGIVPSAGPIASTAADLSLFFKVVIQSKPWTRDSSSLAVPWRHVPRNVLKIGVMLDDKDYPLAPPVKRALQSALTKLKAAGHHVTLCPGLPSLRRAAVIAGAFFSMDNAMTPLSHLKNVEDPIASLAHTSTRNLVQSRKYNIDDLWDSNTALSEYREEWLGQWRAADIDVLLCPGARATAVPHDTFGMPVYTLIWNLLDFPAAVVPFLKVDKTVDSTEGYDAAPVDGAPCSLQIVGWRFQDEEVLMATEVIDQALRE